MTISKIQMLEEFFSSQDKSFDFKYTLLKNGFTHDEINTFDTRKTGSASLPLKTLTQMHIHIFEQVNKPIPDCIPVDALLAFKSHTNFEKWLNVARTLIDNLPTTNATSRQSITDEEHLAERLLHSMVKTGHFDLTVFSKDFYTYISLINLANGNITGHQTFQARRALTMKSSDFIDSVDWKHDVFHAIYHSTIITSRLTNYFKAHIESTASNVKDSSAMHYLSELSMNITDRAVCEYLQTTRNWMNIPDELTTHITLTRETDRTHTNALIAKIATEGLTLTDNIQNYFMFNSDDLTQKVEPLYKGPKQTSDSTCQQCTETQTLIRDLAHKTLPNASL
ncbi:hypothetical protein [Vibrio barjaei]|uniref:hypothetical protein n=1 Tax=Vibrio barjaei TaxID=1676683 RepID=UPI00228376B1|nr:hypothetical protein [Vibrio barjaei]MCY9872955.1 hypothetical protein [Vibrio barjaei]